jgi:hypothetical protein
MKKNPVDYLVNNIISGESDVKGEFIYLKIQKKAFGKFLNNHSLNFKNKSNDTNSSTRKAPAGR